MLLTGFNVNTISFDKTVYSDAGLTAEATGPFNVSSTTKLPKVFFSATEYIGTGKNSKGVTLWTVRFTYPTHILIDGGHQCVTSATGGIFDEE